MIMLNINTRPFELQTKLTSDSREQLEKKLALYLDCKEVIVLDSVETSFALALSGLHKEESVLCSPNAPLALFRTLDQQNRHAEYCDLKLDGTMETRFLHKSQTEQTKAVVLSHNHGIVSDCKATSEFTKKRDLIFIEDATQAFYKSKKSGAELAVYSLDALVPSFVAKGAFIATDNETLARSLRQKAKGGFVHKKFWNYDLVNADLDLGLAPLTAQLALDAFAEINQREKRIKEIQGIYLERLSSNRLIELPKSSDLIPYPLFQVALVPALFCPKEDIYQALVKAGIPIKVGNKPIYKTTAFKDDSLSLFGAEEVFKAQLLLPAHHYMTLDDADFVVETLQSVLETYGYRGCSF